MKFIFFLLRSAVRHDPDHVSLLFFGFSISIPQLLLGLPRIWLVDWGVSTGGLVPGEYGMGGVV